MRRSLSGRELIRTYRLRPVIEADYRQLKSSQWLMDEFTSTNGEQILTKGIVARMLRLTPDPRERLAQLLEEQSE